MNNKARLEALARIAAMRKEADLMAVARADTARDRVKARIDALDSAAAASHQLPATDIASIAAQESFGRLVTVQRADLDRDLAELTEIWRRHRDNAALSFGRARVLEQLRERITDQTTKRRIRRSDDTR
ncbi:MAG: hypothetical protein WBB85_01060 [Albidovulum sp.]|uniref:hypothetical protein n=1 Tax=Albidovulum sp. TaxID=1872424 RepID=UPI003CA3EB7C